MYLDGDSFNRYYNVNGESIGTGHTLYQVIASKGTTLTKLYVWANSIKEAVELASSKYGFKCMSKSRYHSDDGLFWRLHLCVPFGKSTMFDDILISKI